MMASKRGLAVTAGMLVLVTAASFAIWLVPQGVPGGTVVISDHTANLDGIDDRRVALAAGVSELLDDVMAGTIGADEYAEHARESAVIAKSQVAGLLRADPPEEWHTSYGAAVESLRALDSYIAESIVIAKLVESGEVAPDTQRLEDALRASEAMADESIRARP